MRVETAMGSFGRWGERPVMRQQVAFWKHVESLKAASCRSARAPISAQAYWLADLIGLRVWPDAAR